MTLLIHIGYSKTGSTWLQSYFSANKNFEMVERNIISETFGHPGLFEFNSKKIKKDFQTIINKTKIKKRKLVLSNEFLSGNEYLNGGMDASIYADRLKKVFAKAKILIILREQRSFLLSFYKHDISFNGGFWSLKEFLNPDWHFNRRSQFLPRYLKYSGLVNYYGKLFGKKNVLVLPYEMLRNEKNIFLEQIHNFTDTRQKNYIYKNEFMNKSRSILLVEMQRILNRFFNSRPENTIRLPRRFIYLYNRYFFQYLEKIFFKNFNYNLEKKMYKKIDGLIKNYYVNDNIKLQNLVSFDLKKYGYNL